MNRALASFVFTGETLYDIREAPAAEEAKLPVPLPGKIPAKSTLVLVDTLSDTGREFLARIMASVGTSMQDMEIIVERAFPEYDLSALQQVERVIVFGDFAGVIQPADNSEKYHPATSGGKKILVADTLTVIGQNLANEKRNLWNALKEMFGLS